MRSINSVPVPFRQQLLDTVPMIDPDQIPVRQSEDKVAAVIGTNEYGILEIMVPNGGDSFICIGISCADAKLVAKYAKELGLVD